MKQLLLILTVLCSLQYADARQMYIADTVTISLSQCDKVSGDTVFLSSPAKGPLVRLMHRNFRPPYLDRYVYQVAYFISGPCDVYMTVDTTGRIVQMGYNDTMNAELGQAMMKLFHQLPGLNPTLIRGRPVVSKVMIKADLQDAGKVGWDYHVPGTDFLVLTACSCGCGNRKAPMSMPVTAKYPVAVKAPHPYRGFNF